MNIIEKTKKIADFIKLDYTLSGSTFSVRQIKPNGRLGKLKDWNPYEDWNVIMDVMRCIKNLDDFSYFTSINPYSVSIRHVDHNVPISSVDIDESTDASEGDSLIITAVDAIILFIDWYKKNITINDETI